MDWTEQENRKRWEWEEREIRELKRRQIQGVERQLLLRKLNLVAMFFFGESSIMRTLLPLTHLPLYQQVRDLPIILLRTR